MGKRPSAEWTDDRIAAWAREHLADLRALDEEERWSRRDDVVELLLEEGFVRGRTRLRELYTELFVPPEDEPDLREHFPELGAMVVALASARTAARERAARKFQKAAMQEAGTPSILALGDPRTIERLLGAAADRVPAVQEAALDALSFVVPRTRFFAPEVAERVLAVHDASSAAPVRRAAALVLAELDDPRRFRPLASALSAPRLPELARRTLGRAVGLGPRNAPPADAAVITDRLLELLAAEKKLDLKTLLLKALGSIGGRDAAARVRKLGVARLNPDVVDAAMKRMEARAAPGQAP